MSAMVLSNIGALLVARQRFVYCKEAEGEGEEVGLNIFASPF